MDISVEKKIVFEWTDDNIEEDRYEEFEVGEGITIGTEKRDYDGDITAINSDSIDIDEVDDGEISIPFKLINWVERY